MMTEEQKNKFRADFEAENTRMQDALAPFYLGRVCPIDKQECSGPKCFGFQLIQGSTPGKIGGGACSLPVIASQVGPIADGLMAFAQMAANKSADVPRVIGSVGGH